MDNKVSNRSSELIKSKNTLIYSDLEDKVAVVTGAAQGIGLAISEAFYSTGCKLAICDIDLELVASTAKNIAAKESKVKAWQLDVANHDLVISVMEDILKHFGTIDILVNNAGITRDVVLARMTTEQWQQVINVNLSGTFYCSKAVSRYMLKQRHGKIINISSVVGLMGNIGQVNYVASKAGVIGLTKSLAKELAGRNINVNAIAPGFIETRMTSSLPKKVRENMLQMIPLARFGLPSDVAAAVLFLASQASNYITGQTLSVNGGMFM